ncbi:MAG TPA: hypothetical protein PLQ19_00010 [Aeromicrobium sp.]|nr:hypothetical protein [Aeromicrobium sp.]
MTRKVSAALATVALTAGLTLSGCGGGDSKPDASAQEKWVASLCKNLAATTAEVEPPATAGSSAAEVSASISGFLDELGSRLDEQQKILADAGTPPGASAEAKQGYAKAQESLETAANTLDGIATRFKKAKASSQDQLQKAILELGEDLADPATYQGPLIELSASDAGLKKAIESSKECAPILES